MNSKNIENEKKEAEKTQPLVKSVQKNSVNNEEFKRRYFEFYDDIKISDRQDW